MEFETILYEKHNRIAIAKFNRPDVLNAINSQVIEDLNGVINEVEKDKELAALILTGEGKAFVAGADIAYMSSLTVLEAREFTDNGQNIVKRLSSLDIPVIAAINGFALGGGMEIAMACDMRFASDRAKFGQPEVSLGIIPGFGGTQRLPRLVGEGWAKYLIFSGEVVDAAFAKEIGLVQKVVAGEDLIAEAEKYAEKVSRNAPIAVKMSKTAINHGLNLDLHSALKFETEATVSAFASEDSTEGFNGFLEKRSIEFKNK